MNEAEKKLEAEWIVAQSVLGELIMNDFSKESYDKYSVTDFLWNYKKKEPRLSWETWKRYYTENLDTVLNGLKTSVEYIDIDGEVKPIPGKPLVETEEERVKRLDKLEESLTKKRDIELPGKGIIISEFAHELSNRLEKEKVVFYRQDSRQIVELGKVRNSDGKITHTGFLQVRAPRFITLIEKYFNPWCWEYKRSGDKYRQEKSMNKDVGSIVLESHIFEEELPNINRIFTVQTPIIKDGELTFPKVGYDPEFNSWLEHDSPIIENMEMDVEEGKKIIYEMLKEFCFETRRDYINAISAILTPFLRGIFKTGFNTRAPIYAYMANRERSGKDYLAGITGILYEGCALEEPPISNGEYRSSGGNDELRKKIIASMISGKKRLHFSNNRGHMNNSVLESVTTAERYSDRLLGKNQSVTFDNEIDFSFSGNIGITLTPDLANRTIFINLFLDMEDANKREFRNPNLHAWVLENRNKVLSAFYSLIRNWFDKGMPDGTVPFASFPEWARVCGGIMEAADYDNPCKKDVKETGVSIDSQTDEMKELFELCYQERPNEWIDKHDIKGMISISNIMTYMDWGDRSAQTKFGMKLNKFVGRVLSDIRLIVENKTTRPSRWKYKFIKNEGSLDNSAIFGKEMVTFGNDCNLNPTHSASSNTGDIRSSTKVPQVTIGYHPDKAEAEDE